MNFRAIAIAGPIGFPCYVHLPPPFGAPGTGLTTSHLLKLSGQPAVWGASPRRQHSRLVIFSFCVVCTLTAAGVGWYTRPSPLSPYHLSVAGRQSLPVATEQTLLLRTQPEQVIDAPVVEGSHPVHRFVCNQSSAPSCTKQLLPETKPRKAHEQRSALYKEVRRIAPPRTPPIATQPVELSSAEDISEKDSIPLVGLVPPHEHVEFELLRHTHLTD